MAILFSHVTMSNEDQGTTEFFACGFPQDLDDLDGCIACEEYLEEIEGDATIDVHVEGFLYGEGKNNWATPAELAYTRLMERILQIASSDESIILDFFAGSGTTAHSTVDGPVADMLRDYLVGSGIPNEYIFCSSLPGNDVRHNIPREVKERIVHLVA